MLHTYFKWNFSIWAYNCGSEFCPTAGVWELSLAEEMWRARLYLDYACSQVMGSQVAFYTLLRGWENLA